MSLLNDMLCDLSHQQKPAETAINTQESLQDFNEQEQRELFAHTRAVKPMPRTLMPSLVIFVAVLALFSFWKMDFFHNAGSGTANIAIDVPLPPVQNPGGQSNANPATLAPVNAVAMDSNTLEPALGARITALETAINNLSAAVSNADNNEVGEPIADPDFAQVSGYENAFTEPEAQEAAQLAQADEFSQLADEELAQSVSVQDPFNQDPSAPMREAQSQLAPIDEQAQGESQFSIAPNVKWQDQQQAEQANQLAARGQADIAIAKLQNYIATAEQPRESVKVLLDIFASQDNSAAMQTLLARADYLSPLEKYFYSAKIAVAQQKDAQAIQILEAHLDEADQDENYRALLAGLYQRTGMHLEAANHYRRLLAVFGDKPAYWLGFALSQDALNQPQIAAQAYQRVNQYTDLQPQVRTYVEQRIAALQQ
ncbi:MAG TPA: hypothetical protein VLC79_01530 [Cellvibrio sp.]|nr:hypothetical protein [Cellvibrio sp.]